MGTTTSSTPAESQAYRVSATRQTSAFWSYSQHVAALIVKLSSLPAGQLAEAPDSLPQRELRLLTMLDTLYIITAYPPQCIAFLHAEYVTPDFITHLGSHHWAGEAVQLSLAAVLSQIYIAEVLNATGCKTAVSFRKSLLGLEVFQRALHACCTLCSVRLHATLLCT